MISWNQHETEIPKIQQQKDSDLTLTFEVKPSFPKKDNNQDPNIKTQMGGIDWFDENSTLFGYMIYSL